MIRQKSDRYQHVSGLRGALILAVLLMIMLAVPAICSQQYGGKSRLEFSHDYWYFGYMPLEAIVQHSYWIRNTGFDTLKISKVTPGCGCTTAPLSKNAIPPGDSARLSIVFDSKNMFGKMVKEVELLSNDPDKPKAVIRFLAAVNREHPSVKTRPPILRFAPTVAKKNQLLKTLEVVNNYDFDVQLSVVDYPGQLFKVSPTSQKIRAGSSARFEVEQTLIPTNESDILNSLTLEFVGKETDRITVPLVSYFKR